MTQIIEKGRGDTHHIIDVANAEIVMSVRTWAQLCGIGYSTAKRELREGRGPKVTRLTEGRIGITTSAHKAWLASRTEDHGLRKVRRS